RFSRSGRSPSALSGRSPDGSLGTLRPGAAGAEFLAFRSLCMPDSGGIGADRLRSFIERIERLEEEKAALTADIREVYAEAKGEGFDTKVMRQVVRLRKMDANDRQEQEAILDLYKQALGMVG